MVSIYTHSQIGKIDMLKMIRDFLEHRDAAKYKKELEKQEALKRSMILESDVPFFKVLDEEAADVNKRYFWNAAFISGLIEKGIPGDSDINRILNWRKKEAEDKAKEEQEKALKAAREEKKKSDKPWVELVGEPIQQKDEDGNHLIGFELDWNDAFIKDLRRQGFKGATDEQIVNKWLTTLNSNSLQDYNV